MSVKVSLEFHSDDHNARYNIELPVDITAIANTGSAGYQKARRQILAYASSTLATLAEGLGQKAGPDPEVAIKIEDDENINSKQSNLPAKEQIQRPTMPAQAKLCDDKRLTVLSLMSTVGSSSLSFIAV